MSVLKLRRDMVVVEEPEIEPALEIEKPFPLRTIDVDVTEVDETEYEEPRKTILGRIRGWLTGAGVVALLAAYPALIVAGSDVGDRTAIAVDRAQWTAPWAGGAALLMERHFGELGWASDAAAWESMARLTAKPAYQSALAETLGEYVNLQHRHSIALGAEEPDLTAAARLTSASSTGVQLRAARDALLSYDRRLHRRGVAPATDDAHLAAQLGLIESWGERSQAEIARAGDVLGGSPIDETATVAVYKAKARAMTAMTFIDTMAWPDDAKAVEARNAALAAWKAAATFHPLVVLNGSPDGSLFGNHATSMGFLLSKAQEATADYRTALIPPAAVAVAAPAVAVEAATMAPAAAPAVR